MSTTASNGITGELAARVKPPFLRRVRIRGYKSIAFCDVTLEPLTVLVGPNASGKSNFVDALAFLRDVVASGVHHAVKDHGGRDAIFCKTSAKEHIFLGVEIESRSDERMRTWSATIEIEIEINDRRLPVLASEYIGVQHSPGMRSRRKPHLGG